MSELLYIADQPALDEFCQKIQHAPWLAVDTEFFREQTYHSQLCLIQVATAEHIACIDPLALPSLEPLLDRLYQPTVTKILHAAHQDLEIFFQLRGAVPAPVFDTQIAAQALGYGSQLGYAALVQQVLGIVLSKAHTRADWRKRPLAAEWLTYAADDVRYLGEIYHRQVAALRARGWLEALAEDFQILTDPSRFQSHPHEEWQRVREQHRLRGVQRAVLRALAAWREERAYRLDRPRRWILDDSALIDLARHQPETPDQLRLIRSLPAAIGQRHGATLLKLIADARQEPPECWPTLPRRPRLSPKQATQVDSFLAMVTAKADEYGIRLRDLADSRDVEDLVAGKDSRLLHGWRAALIGRTLSALLSEPEPI